jgi:hypothetical protein
MSIILKSQNALSVSSPANGSASLFFDQAINLLAYKTNNNTYYFNAVKSASNTGSTNTLEIYSGSTINSNITNFKFFTISGTNGASVSQENQNIVISASNNTLDYSASNLGSGSFVYNHISGNITNRTNNINLLSITGSSGVSVILSGNVYIISNSVSKETISVLTSSYYIPDPTFFSSATFAPPDSTSHSSAWPISGVVYLFGTYKGGIGSSKILYATMSNPTSWSQVSGAVHFFNTTQQAILGNKIYSFGGRDNVTTNPISTIYSASVNNPLSWSNTGATLPNARAIGSLYVSKETGKIIIYGGITGSFVLQNTIFTASISNPLVWGTAPTTLPGVNFGQTLIEAGDWIYLYGGGTTGSPATTSSVIWRAHKTTPTVVSNSGFTLTQSFGQPCQPIQIGNYVYIFSNIISNGTFRIDINKPWAPEFISGAMSIPFANKFLSPVFIAQNKIFHMGGTNGGPNGANGPNFLTTVHTSSYVTTGTIIESSSLDYGTDFSLEKISGLPTIRSSVEKFGSSAIWQTDIDYTE